MGGLDVTQENLDNQRAIVIEELQSAVTTTDPMAPRSKALTSPCLIPTNPTQRPTIGNIDDVNIAQIEDVIAFHRKYYLPNNATLVVAGDIDFDIDKGADRRTFSVPSPERRRPVLPCLSSRRLIKMKRNTITIEDPFINLPALLVAYEIPPAVHEDFPPLNVLASILSVGDSSRLAKRLVDTGKALQADAWIFDNQRTRSLLLHTPWQCRR